MANSTETKEIVAGMITRLLAGPDRPGQAFTMPGWNYGELYQMARRIKYFFDHQPEKDAPVCLCTDDRGIMAAAMLASLAGAPPLLIPHALSTAALQEMHQATDFSLAIAPTSDLLPSGVTQIDLDQLTDEVETLASEDEPDPDQPWVFLFTGGSTGAPRMWSKTATNLLGEVGYLVNRFEVTQNDRILATVPATHIYGMLYSLLTPLVASARVVNTTPSFPEEIKQQIAGVSPTIFISVPIHYRALKEKPPQKGAMRLAFSSAGPLPEADGAAFSTATGVDLFEIYGSTETGGIATRCRARGEEGLTPYDCIQWRVAGDSLDIRSDFLSSELPIRESGWFTPSDRVKPHGSEGFMVVGRVDNIVKVGGNRVDLEKIRQAILGVEGVEDALVLSRAVETGRDSEIVAIAVGHLPAGDVRKALAKVLEPHEMPRRLRIVTEIPMAATGKIDRRAIEGLFTDHQLKFEPSGLRVSVDENKTLQELAGDHGIAIRADCGGAGVCGKCRVLVSPRESFSPLADSELDVLTPAQLADGARLSCRARAIGSGTVTIPESLAESAETRGKTGISGTYAVDPMIQRRTAKGCSPALNQDNTPESLLDWIADQAGVPAAARADLACLRQLGRYTDSLKDFTLVVHEETGIRRILAGEHPQSLGFAVDLGTTSVAGYLCDLKSGELLAADSCVNPQRRYGEDVISRIGHVNEKDEHLSQLQGLAVEGINLLIERCLKSVGASVEDIDEVAVCGNTTMQQIFGNMHPRTLGMFPYFPLTLIPPLMDAGDLGLAVDPAVPVLLMPVISGFVGGDTMSAILADRPHERDETTLIVDIGTNGELVLGNRKGLWVTSCATGPALEGAQISCGMRAVTGAIHRMWPDPENHHVAYEVLGNQGHNRPMGICGSGIIDAIASMRQMDIILPNGRLNEKADGVTVDNNGIGQSYTIADAEQSATGNAVSVTLKDIRQIQLAKGALATGIEFLMRKAGIETIDRTILTGAFGARFNWKNALAIGMLPPVVGQSEVIPKDNLAGVGVVMALLNKELRAEARSLCRYIRFLELASETTFPLAFARATNFPKID